MRDEIAAAVLFITRLLKKNEHLTQQQIDQFSDRLSVTMLERFKDHWYQDAPYKGQAYRCIRVNHSEPADPTLNLAANACGLHYYDLNLPTELTVWVDPTEVTCRLGEIKASECILLSKRDFNSGKTSATLDIDRLLEKHNATQQAQREKYEMLWSSRRSNHDRSGFTASYNTYHNRMSNMNRSHSPSGYSAVGSPLFKHKFQTSSKNRNNSNRTYSNNMNYSGAYQSNQGSSGNGNFNWVRGADLVMA